jgi:hypothetical protein
VCGVSSATCATATRLENGNRRGAMVSLVEYGSRSWTRTNDPLINSQLLYRLSYPGPTRHGSRPPTEFPPRGGRLPAVRRPTRARPCLRRRNPRSREARRSEQRPREGDAGRRPQAAGGISLERRRVSRGAVKRVFVTLRNGRCDVRSTRHELPPQAPRRSVSSDRRARRGSSPRTSRSPHPSRETSRPHRR